MKAIEMIPIAQIRLLNPRSRNKVKFQEIVSNISKVGLKKPITVARREGETDAYDLVCGQGRLEAFLALGQKDVPAVVLDAPKEDRYIMSLVENIARRSHSTMELVHEIQDLRHRGYTQAQIASKVGVSDGYVSMLLRLLEKGEDRLVQAVERGEIPIAVATEIAASDDASVQRSLADAYTTGKLRGKALIAARRLVELRRARGKGFRSSSRSGQRARSGVTTDELVATYRKETDRQRRLVRKARLCENQLVFIAGALKRLFEDDNFINLLRAEALDTVPEYVADSISEADIVTAPVKAAFESQAVQLKLAKVLPRKKLSPGLKATSKYQAIASSIAEVGIIEPLVVCRQRGGTYLLLDGHARLEVLKDLGRPDVWCIVSTDDEGFTYNSKVSHVAPIQANKMILKALNAGVEEARLAKALNLSPGTIRDARSTLKDICPEALELLKDKHVSQAALRLLKKVKPIRQIEMAELMIASANYSKPYAVALLAATPRKHVLDPRKKSASGGDRPEDIAKMEAEMQALERDVLTLDESYSRNVVNLTVARGYIKKLLENAKVVRYLASKYPDLLAVFQRIQETTSLEA